MVIPLGRPRSLSSLLEDVQAARAAVQQARGLSCGATTTRAAQQALVICLRAFTDELGARRLPVPHALHAEARMYDDLLAMSPR
jgi:hypothetical protein